MSYRESETGAPRHVEKQPGLMSRLDVSGWVARYIGKGVWYLDPNPNPYMVMTGAEVTLDAPIPIPHRLVRFEWKHTTAAKADDATATAITLSRLDPDSGLLSKIYAEAASTSSTTVVPFGEGYEYWLCTYRVAANTTNGHLVYPSLYIQELKP